MHIMLRQEDKNEKFDEHNKVFASTVMNTNIMLRTEIPSNHKCILSLYASKLTDTLNVQCFQWFIAYNMCRNRYA